jgi:hypothetical protein
MSNDNYILVDGKPVQEPDTLKWARWVGNIDNRRVAYDQVGRYTVSTVFLGIDHSFGGGPPLLYETMIFGPLDEEYQERFSTRKEAVAGHAKALDVARKLAAPNSKPQGGAA